MPGLCADNRKRAIVLVEVRATTGPPVQCENTPGARKWATCPFRPQPAVKRCTPNKQKAPFGVPFFNSPPAALVGCRGCSALLAPACVRGNSQRIPEILWHPARTNIARQHAALVMFSAQRRQRRFCRNPQGTFSQASAMSVFWFSAGASPRKPFWMVGRMPGMLAMLAAAAADAWPLLGAILAVSVLDTPCCAEASCHTVS